MHDGRGARESGRSRVERGRAPAPGHLHERIEVLGAAALADAELLGVVLAGRDGAVAPASLVRRLLEGPGGCGALSDARVTELRRLGLSRARASRLCAAFALARRCAHHSLLRAPALDSPRAATAALEQLLGGRRREVFVCLHLDARNRVLACEELFQGTIDGAVVHVREVVAGALRAGAVNVLLAHNHPSGDPEPSAADAAITRRLQAALGLVDVGVLDHLVIGAGRTVSLAERGLLARG